jgi:hypothetical protein
MPENELRMLVKDVISSTGTVGMKDMGKVMGLVAQKTAGKADNRLISQIVKELLGLQ